jgi:hypothetical protein
VSACSPHQGQIALNIFDEEVVWHVTKVEEYGFGTLFNIYIINDFHLCRLCGFFIDLLVIVSCRSTLMHEN